MKYWLILSISCLLLSTVKTQEDIVNPEDVDDVRPPVEENEQKQNGITKKTTTASTLSTQKTTKETNINVQGAPNSIVKLEAAKPDIEKKEELLTGKEEVQNVQETTPAVETKAPKANSENEKEENVAPENAAPEFEVKQEVEGGKGEEDPDANVDKPVQADPPKDEADGRAKEDRESAPIGAAGLHEAVEEAKGNPAPGAPAIEQKKDSADEEQTLDAGGEQPIAPNRVDPSQDTEPRFQKMQREEESSGFMSFFLVASFLVIFIYILQHNKKKILGLMFEGRTSKSASRRGGNVKYRRLSQSDSIA